MKMIAVAIGMRLCSTIPSIFSPVTVTEITERGIKYDLDSDIHDVLAGEPVTYIKSGGEAYAVDGELLYLKPCS